MLLVRLSHLFQQGTSPVGTESRTKDSQKLLPIDATDAERKETRANGDESAAHHTNTLGSTERSSCFDRILSYNTILICKSILHNRAYLHKSTIPHIMTTSKSNGTFGFATVTMALSSLILTQNLQPSNGFAYIQQPDGGLPAFPSPNKQHEVVVASPNQHVLSSSSSTLSPSSPDPLLLKQHAAFANELANEARTQILPYWRQSRHTLGQQIKTESNRSVFQSASPVTLADRAAERVMRDLIEKEFPEHGIYGEEFGVVREDADWVWVRTKWSMNVMLNNANLTNLLTNTTHHYPTKLTGTRSNRWYKIIHHRKAIIRHADIMSLQRHTSHWHH